MRGTRGVLVGGAAIALAVASLTGTAVAKPTPPKVGALGKTRDVIIVLRDQHTNLQAGKGTSSPRALANRASQAPVLALAQSAGVRNLHAYNNVNELSAAVTDAQAQALKADPAVAAIYPDLAVKAAPVLREQVVKSRAAPKRTSASPQPICPSDPSEPLLEPEALGVTRTAFSDNTPSAQGLVDGSGVKVAFIADGLDVNNPDFIRANSQHVFVDYQDFSGDGTAAPTGSAEAFGDASAIAAQGRQVYDLKNYVNPAHPLPPGCNITVRGMAPGASLVGLKVFGNSNFAPTSHFIDAIDYAITAGVDVLNESFGGNPFPDTGNDPITLADKAAVAAGVTVVASTGDAGTNGTVGSPASSGAIIGVGATTTFQSYMQEAYGGAQLSNGQWTNNNISSLSSGGQTQANTVPDLVAPGDLGWALCTPNLSLYEECSDDKGAPSPIQNFGGTSQSSPLTAGAAALVIEAYESTHGGTHPTPAMVKQILTSTAQDLGHPAFEQGAGLLDALNAVRTAESMPGSPSSTTDALLPSVTQVSLSGKVKQNVSTTITLQNLAPNAQTVSATTRSFENVVNSTNDSFTLNTTTAPTYVDSFGIERSFVTRPFTVGTADRLDVSFAAPAAPNGAMRVILLDPNGTYTAYSLPQGNGNFGHVDVRNPPAGAWTAIFAISQNSGFIGPVSARYVQTDVTTHGKVTPASQMIPAGGTATFTLTTKLPSTPSDLSTSLQFAGSTGGLLSVPVSLRADLGSTGGKGFTGIITGGNGRGGNGSVGQSNIYYINVPKNKKALSLGFRFSDPNQLYLATLMAPDGQVYSFPSSTALDGDNLDLTNGIQIYRRTPQPGQWVLSLDITNPVSGMVVSQSFTCFMSFSAPKIKVKMPKSAKTMLAAGVPVTVPVTITNTGVQPLTYFADARLSSTRQYDLGDITGNGGVFALPQTAVPAFLVPTETNELGVLAQADQPINLDYAFESGNPDLYSSAANGDFIDMPAAEVTPGVWFADVGQVGPFGSPAPAGVAQVFTATISQVFDGTVTSNTPDFWSFGVDPAELPPSLQSVVQHVHPTFLAARSHAAVGGTAVRRTDANSAPLTLGPGQTGTFNVTITPSGASGTVAQGTLYIDTWDYYTDGGSELVAVPYEYTIK
jgi:hypothetical protein